jgi:N-acetylglucosamine-6-phosphate deacetylase
MPSAVPTSTGRITKFTNCKLVIGNEFVEQDLWVSSATGKIVRSQEVFYGENVVPDITIDLKGKIVAPGLIDVQLNGAFGFNFSQIPQDPSTYGKTLRQVNKRLIQTGVTSYLPTLTSEKVEVYHQVGDLHFKIQNQIAQEISRHSHSSAPQAPTASQKTAPNLSAPTSKDPSSTQPKTESTK